MILTEQRTEQVQYRHDEQQADTTERPTEGSNNQENTEDTKDNETMNEDDLEESSLLFIYIDLL